MLQIDLVDRLIHIYENSGAEENCVNNNQSSKFIIPTLNSREYENESTRDRSHRLLRIERI